MQQCVTITRNIIKLHYSQAHQQNRRAEAHLKYNRFDEAMLCHNNAAELLLDAMKSTSSSVALESITLQHSYHLKQKDLIKHKKDQYARVKKAMDNIKRLAKEPSSAGSENTKIQVAIYKAINESDGLLDVLANGKDKSTIETACYTDCNSSKDTTDGKTEPNKQAVVDEVLHLNHSLRILVEQLVMQFEVIKDDNISLNERVKYLEKERNKYMNSQVSDFIQQNNFSNISIGTEALPKDDVQSELASAALLNKGYGVGMSRPMQQPHFDLSAFKND